MTMTDTPDTKGEALLPCPFCGGKAKLFARRVSEDMEAASVECLNCRVGTDCFEDAYAPKADAIAAWNTRHRFSHPPQPAMGEVERLVDYLFGDDRNNNGVRVVDLCFTAFMNRDKPNPDDGEDSDWFNDTKPLIDKGITAMKARILAALSQPPAVATPAADAEVRTGAVSDDALAHLRIRSPLNNAIYKAVRGYVMSNMTDADDHACGYPLVDLMSNPAPADIGTGEIEMVYLTDEIENAVLAASPKAPAVAIGAGEVERERDEARQIVRDIYWMARRYADGRQSYAVGMFNDAVRKGYDAGWLEHKISHEPPFARDSMFSPEWKSIEARAVEAETALAAALEAAPASASIPADVERELREDVAYLLARSGNAGKCMFGGERWTGISSNALVAIAFGCEDAGLPGDSADLAACYRAVMRLPEHRRTAAVFRHLERGEQHVEGKYPGSIDKARKAAKWPGRAALAAAPTPTDSGASS